MRKSKQREAYDPVHLLRGAEKFDDDSHLDMLQELAMQMPVKRRGWDKQGKRGRAQFLQRIANKILDEARHRRAEEITERVKNDEVLAALEQAFEKHCKRIQEYYQQANKENRK